MSKLIITHSFEGMELSFYVDYKKRKTIGIYIDEYGMIEVRVPKGISQEQVIKVVENKWNWMVTKSNEIKERTKGYKKKEYESGEEFMYMGKNYPVNINKEADEDRVSLENSRLEIWTKDDSPEYIQSLLKRFYKSQCKKIVEKRIKVYQPNFKMKPRKIKISDNKSNWGTCNNKLELTFNWKLAMAPLDSIDYVIVHEMCHMVHLNHERSFWRLVGKIYPDYEEAKRWLNLSSWKMTI